jgi:hypothetical protein
MQIAQLNSHDNWRALSRGKGKSIGFADNSFASFATVSAN